MRSCFCAENVTGNPGGKRKMTFSDLNRLIYLLDYLGLDAYSLEIWSEYGGQFKDQLEQLKEIYDETAGIVSWDPAEEDERQEQWIREFLRQVPDRNSRKLLEITRLIYKYHFLLYNAGFCAK